MILVQQACRAGHREQVPDGVGHEPRRFDQFLGQRQDLPQQGIGRVVAAHPGQVTAGNAQREAGCRPACRFDPACVESQARTSTSGIGHAVLQGPLPAAGLEVTG